MEETKVRKISFKVASAIFDILAFASTQFLQKRYSGTEGLTKAVNETARALFLEYCEFLGIEEVGDEDETDLIDDYDEKLFRACCEHLRKEGNW